MMKKYQNVKVFHEYMNVQVSESVHITLIFMANTETLQFAAEINLWISMMKNISI